MFEKTTPSHVDKLADRIAGAMVDLAYKKANDGKELCYDVHPKVAVEVLLGHGKCYIINETSQHLDDKEVYNIVEKITGNSFIETVYNEVPQDPILAGNQETLHCGDNGIFKGIKTSPEERELTRCVQLINDKYPYDGKYIIDSGEIIACQSNCKELPIKTKAFNPLGYWTGGINVDSGATNRKLGSDMGRAVTGGGLCLSGDTEYISDDFKWHKISDYKGGKVGQWNNGTLEFVKPRQYIHNKNDLLISFENNTKLSMVLTPYHEILIKTSKGNLIKHYAGDVADKLKRQQGNQGSIIHNFTYTGNDIQSCYPNENLFRLQVAFCADGTILGNSNKKWRGRIQVKKQYKKERLRELLKDIPYLETQDNEYSIFWFKPYFENKSLYECFKNEISSWDILYNEIFLWDGDKKRKLFRTMNKEDADFIQFVIASFGKVATITENKGCYSVHELNSTTTGLRVNKGSTIKVKMLDELHDSYCFLVPSHNLIVRHNNRIFVTGNCGKDLTKADVSVNIYLHLLANQPESIINRRDEVYASCAIGDSKVKVIAPTEIHFINYEEIVAKASEYIKSIGGFEKLAEWGLIR